MHDILYGSEASQGDVRSTATPEGQADPIYLYAEVGTFSVIALER
jgi:hypothetical protein